MRNNAIYGVLWSIQIEQYIRVKSLETVTHIWELDKRQRKQQKEVGEKRD